MHLLNKNFLPKGIKLHEVRCYHIDHLVAIVRSVGVGCRQCEAIQCRLLEHGLVNAQQLC